MNRYFILIASLIGMVIGSAGTVVLTKAVKPKIIIPPCPPCNCPPAVEVSLQNPDFDKIKRSTVHYSQSLSNVKIVIENKDSLLIKRLLRNGNCN